MKHGYFNQEFTILILQTASLLKILANMTYQQVNINRRFYWIASRCVFFSLMLNKLFKSLHSVCPIICSFQKDARAKWKFCKSTCGCPLCRRLSHSHRYYGRSCLPLSNSISVLHQLVYVLQSHSFSILQNVASPFAGTLLLHNSIDYVPSVEDDKISTYFAQNLYCLFH